MPWRGPGWPDPTLRWIGPCSVFQKEEVEFGSGSVRQDGVESDGEYRRGLARERRRDRVPDEVDPPVQAVQPAGVGAIGDTVPADPARSELRGRDRAMLPAGNKRNSPIATTRAGDVEFVTTNETNSPGAVHGVGIVGLRSQDRGHALNPPSFLAKHHPPRHTRHEPDAETTQTRVQGTP